jgi:uncharacterized membrane protein
VDYHDNFWVTVGAAAPVIALAGVVGITEVLKLENRLDRLKADAGRPWRSIRGYRRAAVLKYLVLALALLNVLVQGFALEGALFSLLFSDNEMSPAFPAIGLPIGVFLVALTVPLTSWLAATVRTIRTRLGEGPEDTQAERHSPKPTAHSDDAALLDAAKPDPGADHVSG